MVVHHVQTRKRQVVCGEAVLLAPREIERTFVGGATKEGTVVGANVGLIVRKDMHQPGIGPVVRSVVSMKNELIPVVRGVHNRREPHLPEVRYAIGRSEE